MRERALLLVEWGKKETLTLFNITKSLSAILWGAQWAAVRKERWETFVQGVYHSQAFGINPVYLEIICNAETFDSM